MTSVDGFVLMECQRIMEDPSEPAARRRLAREWYHRLAMDGERSATPVAYPGGAYRHTPSSLAQYAQTANYEGDSRANS